MLQHPLNPMNKHCGIMAVDNPVIKRTRQVHHLAQSHECPCATGRATIRFGAIMATSGALMIGVVATPPSAPRELIVIVDPVNSSRPIVPSRAAWLNRATSSDNAHSECVAACRMTGTIRPALV
jgi:hypothetical protein